MPLILSLLHQNTQYPYSDRLDTANFFVCNLLYFLLSELFLLFCSNTPDCPEALVTKASGITANEQLALMRAAGVKNYIEKNVTTLDNTKNEYEYHVEVAKERGGEFRKINVEFVIMDAFPAK